MFHVPCTEYDLIPVLRGSGFVTVVYRSAKQETLFETTSAIQPADRLIFVTFGIFGQ